MPQESASSPRSALFSPKKRKPFASLRTAGKKTPGRLKIGVLYGGSSSERKISIRSGRAVHQALRRSGFSAVAIDPRNWKKAVSQLKKVDVAFVALHGKGGEDGKIQRELEKRAIPYIGSDAQGSRLAYDKELSKKIFVKNNIPTAPFRIISKSGWKSGLKSFPVPVFVKPVTEGSSIGAFAVEDLAQDAVKIERARRRFGRLLVEKKINGREFTVGIFGKKALPVVEMRPKSQFYDYHSKYTKGMTDYHVPANIPVALSRRFQKIALRVHHALKLRDFSRVDIMADEKNRPYVLEANSIPGFTELSLLPKAAKSAGISFEELCCGLVSFAYQRSKTLKRKS